MMGLLNLREIGYTNDKGELSFSSVEPGNYGNRRKHIHWKVFKKGYEVLTTQSYWLSEKGTPIEDKDGTDTDTEICRYVDFALDGNAGMVGRFDIYLKKS